MKTLLVTGGSGYLGRWLLPALRAKGYCILLLSRSRQNLSLADYVYTHEELEKAFCSHEIWGVIHLAACYGRQNESAEEVLLANTVFPLRLLELSVKYKVPHFLNTDTILSPLLNPYSLSKNQFFQWLSLYADKIKVINLRLDHFYGPHDKPIKFIAWLIEQFRREVPEINLTEGSQSRDFIYIDDVVSAFLTVIDSIDNIPVGKLNNFEVGTNHKTSIKDVVLIIKNQMGSAKTKLNFGAIPYRKNEVLDYEVDTSALHLLGWKPHYISVEEGIKKLLEVEREGINK